MIISELLKTRYVKHGRVIPELDCWGLAIIAWDKHHGKGILPSYSHISPDDKDSLTIAALSVRDEFQFHETALRDAVIATAWRGRKCDHVGVSVSVDGRIWILETDEATGPTLTKPSVFESRYSKVIYYDNQRIS